MSGGRWSAALLGAALLDRDGLARHCRCAHGTCDRCLARVRAVPRHDHDGARTAQRDLSRALDLEADAVLAGDPLAAETHRAAAVAALDLLLSLGVEDGGAS